MTHNTIVTGHRYYLGAHMTLCHGPIDKIERIRVSERTAWAGDFSGAGSVEWADVAATTLGHPLWGPPLYGLPSFNSLRVDRFVFDLSAAEPRIVVGTEAGSAEGATAPPTPSGTISLATMVSAGRSGSFPQDPGAWFPPDNSARDPDHFQDPDNDLRIEQDGSFPISWSVSAGAIRQALLGTALFIDREGLFGGEKREGGIRGRVSVALGTATQAPNEYLQTVLGTVPAFRHIAALVLEQVYVGTIARIKPWAITAQRAPVGLSPEIALIGDDANPVHIIHEVITERRWGMGYSPQRVHMDDFEAAAQTLYDEGFGLSLLWSRESESGEDFIRRVAETIDASVYVDIATGRWRITLHRDDYDAEQLPALDRSSVVSVERFERPGYGDLVSELTVTYTDGEGEDPSWKTKAVSQQNLAVMRAQSGRRIAQTREYPGITNGSLANRVLARDLRQLGRPLARVELVLTAEHTDIRPGSVYRWSDLDHGVEQMILRVVEIEYGTIADGEIRIKAGEDVFGAADAVFADPTPTEWVDPVAAPTPAPHRRLMEATYYHVALDLSDSPTLIAEVPETAGRLVTQAVAPAGTTYGYDVHIDAGEGFHRDGDRGEHCPTATLAGDITGDQRVIAFAFAFASAVDLSAVSVDEWAYIGDEIVAVRAIDPAGRVATVDRGILDTTPVPHPVGARVYFGDGFETYSRHEFTQGEQIDVKIAPTTSGGTLELVDAPTDSYTFDARFIRPYPPGRVRFNGADFPAAVQGVPVISWAHRDRTQQTGPLIDQDAGNIGPEPGTTYTLRIRDQNGNLVRTVTGIDATEYEYQRGAEIADGGPFTAITWELESVRDDWVSWQYQSRSAELYGYGRQYGVAYGGLSE